MSCCCGIVLSRGILNLLLSGNLEPPNLTGKLTKGAHIEGSSLVRALSTSVLIYRIVGTSEEPHLTERCFEYQVCSRLPTKLRQQAAGTAQVGLEQRLPGSQQYIPSNGQKHFEHNPKVHDFTDVWGAGRACTWRRYSQRSGSSASPYLEGQGSNNQAITITILTTQ